MDLASQTALLVMLMLSIGSIAALSYYQSYSRLQPKGLTLTICAMLFLVTPFALVYLAMSIALNPAQQRQPQWSRAEVASENNPPQRVHLSLVK